MIFIKEQIKIFKGQKIILPLPCLLDIIALFHGGERIRKTNPRRKKVKYAVMKNIHFSFNLSVVCQGITVKYML